MMGAWIDQYDAIIYHGVAVIGHTLLLWYLVIGNAFKRKISIYTYLILILKRRMLLTRHMLMRRGGVD
jgi:hypothetical protein